MTDLTDLTIAEAAAQLQARKLSPVDLAAAYLSRIERLNPAINAYVTVTAERALADARAAEKEFAAGAYRGALHGIPIGLKDLVDTAGIRTTGGAKIFADRVPAEDATIAKRLRAAGTVLLGKTNTHELAFGATTNNPHYGPTRNPWDTDRVPGGSSGGSGAAIAARIAGGAIGTDTGGSIRIPAAVCGCVGLKPTYGRVSKKGILPMSWLVDHPGPIVRTVEDAAIMLQAIAGYDPSDFATVPMPVPDYRAALGGGVRGLRVGVPPAFFTFLDPEVKAAVEAAVAWFGREGAEMVELDLPVDREKFGVAFAVVIAESREAVAAEWDARPQDFGADLQAIYSRPLPDGIEFARSLRTLYEIGEAYRVAMEAVDVVLVPTVPIPAPPIGLETMSLGGVEIGTTNLLASLTGWFNVARVPTMSLPCGFSSGGLPLGMSLAAKPFDEAAVLRAGHAYEQAHDWHNRRAPLA
jgi:aspartyl-tRNA(Asn)/glutamyl-tRNA(Gln) amidotransferase subunit A